VPPRGFRALTIKEELYDKLQKAYKQIYDEDRLRPSFSVWVSEIL
jgi:hypothetical protein